MDIQNVSRIVSPKWEGPRQPDFFRGSVCYQCRLWKNTSKKVLLGKDKKSHTVCKVFNFCEKYYILWPRTPRFWPSQSSLAPPMMVRWCQTMAHWNLGTYYLFQISNKNLRTVYLLFLLHHSVTSGNSPPPTKNIQQRLVFADQRYYYRWRYSYILKYDDYNQQGNMQKKWADTFMIVSSVLLLLIMILSVATILYWLLSNIGGSVQCSNLRIKIGTKKLSPSKQNILKLFVNFN